MRRSNRNFNISRTRHFTNFSGRGMGNLTGKAFLGGEFYLCLGGLRKIEPEV